jgi:predicted RNase H-like nuclease
VDEVDRLMTPERQCHLVEVHPEVSLGALAMRPMTHYKKRPEGRTERLEVLRGVFPDIDQHIRVRTGEARPDDIIDAFAVAWSARRWVARTYLRLGGELDGRGLRMEIVA